MAKITLTKTTPKSLAFQERGKLRIPGLTQLLSKRPDQFAPGVWPGYYRKASGVEVWDLDDNRYIDMSISGIGANVLGYADPDVDAAVMAAVATGASCSLNCPEEVELAELLCEIHPWAEMARFTRSGGEAMTVAVRIARAFTGRDTIAFCGYHGWHDWYLAANLGTENALGEHLLPGLEPRGVPRALEGTTLPFRYNHIEDLEDIIRRHRTDIAAIVMEPIRNDEPLPGFLEEVRALAIDIGAVLIFDEISAGFRLNSGGSHLLYHVNPDMAVFSKAIGNGYAISAVIGKTAVMEAAQRTFISSTNWTERIGPAAALATIRKHRELNASEHLITIGKAVQQGWQELSEHYKLPLDIGGIAPLSHFAFEHADHLKMKSLFVQSMLEQGFLASTVFYSMYAHTGEHVKAYLKAADAAFADIAQAITLGKLDERMKGTAATAGFKRLN